ncbi:VTT domain-containing protein [Shewanella avicenniae]|uniref:TVP38/TMEM64 family membrane protein n=1 Tax=Shewanella avicenniae TaxID=2814294 RepID=A0ABX7QXJ1_9GAMM|nr:VTT domain-containing protein [Shewanella avicenniae]
MTSKQFGKSLFTVLIFVLLALLVETGWFEHLTDKHWVAELINQDGISGDAMVFGCAVLFMAVGGPRQLVALVYGYTLGSALGTLMAALAAIVGCSVTFYVARFTVKGLVNRHFGKKTKKFEQFICHKTWLKVVIIRFLPVGSNLVTNLLAGSTHTPSSGFFLGSFIGYLPQTFIFASAGAGIGFSDHFTLLFSCILLVASSLIGTYLYRRRVQPTMADILAEEKETQA